MITLGTLRWDDCFSYSKNNSLDLTSSNLTQLIGTNGVGKSSIPLILEEVLYNKNSKGIKKADIQNRYYNRGYNNQVFCLWSYCVQSSLSVGKMLSLAVFVFLVLN